ncbi:hypothetical protein MGSAQ_000404, partial [marine sediment metagenome]
DADGHYLHMTHPEIVAQNIRHFVEVHTHV